MTELALVDQPHAIDVGHWAEVLTFAARMADAVADTEFVPGALRGKREAVAATIMYGAEVGVTPMQALAGIHIVDGRPQPSAELMRAMILRAGHTITVHEMSGTRARVSGLRRGRPESERVVVEWTTDQARAAGLLGRPNWRNYPRAMLVARASGDLARILFPDVVKGLGYVAEDDPEVLDSWAPAASSVRAEVEAPVRKPLQRRKRSVADTPVQTAVLPAEGALTGTEKLEPDVDDNRTDRWLTDEEAIAREATVAEQARAAIEAALVEDERPSVSPPVIDLDVPLPDDMQPVGTGRPHPPLTDPVPTSPDNEATPPRVMPDPEPEAPEPEGRHEPPKVGVRPLKAIQVGLTRELGTAATREERHALLAAIVNRPVASSKDLLRHEGYRVLDYLDRFVDGSASWAFDVERQEAGQPPVIVVVDNREPPPEGE